MKSYLIGLIVVFVQLFLVCYFFASVFVEFDTRPNKAARKQIKLLAKRTGKMRHEIINDAIYEYLNKRIEEEKQAYQEIYSKQRDKKPPTFEEWKAQREKEQQEQQK